MAGKQVDVSEGGDELRVSFPYDPRLVALVKSLARRRFEPLTKTWVCPADDVREVVELLVDQGFAITATARSLYRRHGGTALRDGDDVAGADGESPDAQAGSTLFDRIVAKAGASAESAKTSSSASPASSDSPASSASASTDPSAAAASFTVSDLNARVHRALLRAFPDTLWIVGELAGFDRNRHRPHVHFDLVEKATDAEGGAIKASVNAVVFERTRRALEKKLAQSEAPFELKDGIEVRLLVRVDLYEPKGSYQLVVEDIDPIHTLGKLAQNRAAVLAELDRLGLRETNRSLPFPELPLRVGLITSVGSDAYNDFVNELARSGFAFELSVADARMQGAGLERGLVRAIQWFSERAAGFDLLAIVRGGGARTDLMWFDNLAVALAVARCPLKVVSGIGHQRDVSVIDLIAHPEKTPTAAAATLVARVQQAADHVEDSFRRLAEVASVRLEESDERLRAAAEQLARTVRAAFRLERTRMVAAARGLLPASRSRLRERRRELGEARVRLLSFARAQTRLKIAALGALAQQLAPERFGVFFERRSGRLLDLDRLAQSFDPRRVLCRGFALVRDEAGRTVRAATAVRPGGTVVATLAQGRLVARVERAEDDASTGGA